MSGVIGSAGSKSGVIGIISQNIALSSGKGIDFGATANSSGTMTSEVFTDYEEGEFTPDLDLSGGGYGTRYGRYIRIGNTVNIWTRITVTGHSSATGTANHVLSGLPFNIDTEAQFVFGIFKTAAGANVGEGTVNNSTTILYRAAIPNSEATYYGNVTYKI